MIPKPSMITNTMRTGIRTAGSLRICRALTFSSGDSMLLRRPNRVRGVSSGLLLAPALVTCESAGGPLRGEALSGLRAVGPAALAWEDGTVTYAGPTSGLPDPVSAGRDATQVEGAVVPGFVD